MITYFLIGFASSWAIMAYRNNQVLRLVSLTGSKPGGGFECIDGKWYHIKSSETIDDIPKSGFK